MRTSAERGLYGRWLTDVRETRGYKTAAEARKALGAAGINIGHSTYAEYESGTKPPSKNHLPALERFWGPVYDPAPAPTDDPLAVALTDLAAELRAAREERATLVGRVAALELTVERLARQAIEAPSAPRVRQGTAG